MNEEERFNFDLTGFLVRPGILSPAEIAGMVDQIERMVHDPMSLPPAHRATPGGALGALIDHPKILEVLHEVIGPHLRVNSSTLAYRTRGERHVQDLHQGGAVAADPLFGYRVQGGQIFAGMVRVVVELTDVTRDDGATTFLPGSHKSSFPIPQTLRSLEPPARSEFAMSYECPAGSAIFFTEQLGHGGPVWKRESPRVAILNAYTHVAINHHLAYIPPAVIDGLTPERQAYFREPWLIDWRDPDRGTVVNSVDRYVADGDRPLSFDRPHRVHSQPPT